MFLLLVNLRHTMESGQPPHFLWTAAGSGYWRQLGVEKIAVEQSGNGVKTSERHAKHVMQLLREQDDLKKIYGEIATDAVMQRAVRCFYGMRLTKNGEWETLVSYVCSQNSNIKRIRKNVQQLSRNGIVFSPEEISEMPAGEIKKINLGYRTQFLQETARMVAEKEFDLAGVSRLGYVQAAKELQLLPGVGPKVADCVLLYGFGMLEAFPRDVWVGRAMRKWYGVRTPGQVRELAEKRWGGFAGYAQQYLFMHAREQQGANKWI